MAQGLTNAPAGDVKKNDLAQKAEKIHKHSAADITSGTLSVARGGTGATTAAGIRNALGLGNTTGALPVANGGTGQTTAAGIRNTLGLGNTTGALPVANGGTGQTTAAGIRNTLGLGNTTGALPVANGGTGAITASAARTALGAFSSSGGTISGDVTINGTVAEGVSTQASGMYSHAEGSNTEASGIYAHTEGRNTKATALCTHAGGYFTIAAAPRQTVIGENNKESTDSRDVFIIGNGSGDTSRSNCLRVTNVNGVYSNSTYKSSGADYAEFFQWFDDNPNNEDRVGLFVTLDGEKIRLAEPEDDYILGIVSGCPSILGDVYDDNWKGMYETDIYGRPIFEEVEVPAETMEVPDPENPEQTITKVICKAHKEIRQKLNPNYDPTQEYVPRSERPEWDAVGMMGKLVVIDDGTCKVNGWCTVGNGGIATNSEKRTKYRVMARLDKTHVKIMIL